MMKRLLTIIALTITLMATALTARADRMLKVTLKTGQTFKISLFDGATITFPGGDHVKFVYHQGEEEVAASEIVKVEHIDGDSLTGVTTPAADASITLDGSLLRLSGVGGATLYSTDGTTVAALASDGTIDLTHLPHSIYIIATPLGTYKIRR